MYAQAPHKATTALETNRFSDDLRVARAGDLNALGRLFESFRTYLLVIATRKIDDDIRAKLGASDVVQDTLCEAQHKFASFGGENESQFRAWLRRALLNNLHDTRRLYAGTLKRSASREVPFERCRPQTLVDPQLTPVTSLVGQEDDVRLRSALLHLPDDYRRVIDLRFRQDLAFAEIGRLMQRSPDATRMLLFRAIERLQEILEGRHVIVGQAAGR